MTEATATQIQNETGDDGQNESQPDEANKTDEINELEAESDQTPDEGGESGDDAHDSHNESGEPKASMKDLVRLTDNCLEALFSREELKRARWSAEFIIGQGENRQIRENDEKIKNLILSEVDRLKEILGFDHEEAYQQVLDIVERANDGSYLGYATYWLAQAVMMRSPEYVLLTALNNESAAMHSAQRKNGRDQKLAEANRWIGVVAREIFKLTRESQDQFFRASVEANLSYEGPFAKMCDAWDIPIMGYLGADKAKRIVHEQDNLDRQRRREAEEEQRLRNLRNRQRHNPNRSQRRDEDNERSQEQPDHRKRGRRGFTNFLTNHRKSA